MSKGKRREREAAELYEQAGYETYRPQESKWGETDIFGLFDVLAIKPGEDSLFAQVKSNRVRGIREWFRDVEDVLGPGPARVHYLVAHDGEGWRLAQRSGDGYEWFVDERDRDVTMGAGVVEYLSDGGDGETG